MKSDSKAHEDIQDPLPDKLRAIVVGELLIRVAAIDDIHLETTIPVRYPSLPSHLYPCFRCACLNYLHQSSSTLVLLYFDLFALLSLWSSRYWTILSAPSLSFWVFCFITFYLSFVNNCRGCYSVNHWSSRLIIHSSNQQVTIDVRQLPLLTLFRSFLEATRVFMDWKVLRLGCFPREEHPPPMHISGCSVLFSTECDSEIRTSVSDQAQRERSNDASSI